MYGYTKMEVRALSKQEHLARHKREALLSESYNLNLWLPTKLTYYNKEGGISCLQLCKKKKWREIEPDELIFRRDIHHLLEKFVTRDPLSLIAEYIRPPKIPRFVM